VTFWPLASRHAKTGIGASIKLPFRHVHPQRANGSMRNTSRRAVKTRHKPRCDRNRGACAATDSGRDRCAILRSRRTRL